MAKECKICRDTQCLNLNETEAIKENICDVCKEFTKEDTCPMCQFRYKSCANYLKNTFYIVFFVIFDSNCFSYPLFVEFKM